MSGLYFLHPFLDNNAIDSVSFGQKLFPLDDFPREIIVLILIVIVDDNEVQGSFFQKIDIFGNILPILSDDHLALGMLPNILTGSDGIGGIDADWQAPREKTPKESDKPLRGVEANDVDGRVLLDLIGQESLCKTEALMVVLFEVHSLPPFVYFKGKGRPFSFLTNRLLKLINQGSWSGSSHSFLAKTNRQLCFEIIRPH